MFSFNQETLIKLLTEDPDFKNKGVELKSYGKPRDGFKLPIDVPNWVSGFGGKYEMRHTNVPAGTMIAVGNLEEIDLTDMTKLKAQLKEIDIYPTGHSGDFTGTDVNVLQRWFTERSHLDNEVNPQTPIAHVRALTAQGLGAENYKELAAYVADNMNLFKNPDVKGVFVPADKAEHVAIAEKLLQGLSETVRYTRLDEPATAFQFTGHVTIQGADEKSIQFNLSEPSKIMVLRRHKNGLYDISPLDRAMIGRTYVTADGKSLGNRGSIDISEVAVKALALENAGHPTREMPFYRQEPQAVLIS